MNLASLGRSTFTAAPPVGDTPIASIVFDWNNETGDFARSTDNHPHTWAADGNLYVVGGDGDGFDTGVWHEMVVSQLSGTIAAPSGTDVYAADTGKAYGILSVNGGELYMTVLPGSNTTNYNTVTIWKSTNSGVSWTPAGWNWAKATSGIAMPTFLQMGQDYGLNTDGYVYMYANGLEDDSSLTIQHDGSAGYIYLARCRKADLMSENSWGWWNGSGWGAIGSKAPVVTDTDGVGWCTSGVAYHPASGRYLLTNEHTTTIQGRFKVWEAQYPWGPWTNIYNTQFPAVGGFNREAFCCYFVPKWFDGMSGVLSQSGADVNGGARYDDSLHYVPFTLSY